ncbi:MAG: hypothetical protein MUO53_06305 [Maribacter sp.]|nr:hypothetical protein [Maribacter sp.]
MLESMDSMLNENNSIISNGFLTSQIKYHEEFAPFARRPLTSWFIEGTAKALDLKLGYSFIVVNFFFLFLSGVLVFVVSGKIGATKSQGYLNMAAYFLSYSVLFSFFPPVFSYDEPVQYCCILLAILALLWQKWPLYVALFTLALLARETSVLLLPGLVYVFGRASNEPSTALFGFDFKNSVKIVLPVLFYMIFLAIYLSTTNSWTVTQGELSQRFSCFLENFENEKNTVESITSFFLAIGAFLYIAIFSLKSLECTATSKKYLQAFLLTLAINTPIVFLTAFARESRLFALPLFFIWPLFAQLFQRQFSNRSLIEVCRKLLKRKDYILSILLFNILNYLYCFSYYKKLGLGENNYFAEYLFIMLFVISLHFMINWFVKNEKVSRNLP